MNPTDNQKLPVYWRASCNIAIRREQMILQVSQIISEKLLLSELAAIHSGTKQLSHTTFILEIIKDHHSQSGR